MLDKIIKYLMCNMHICTHTHTHTHTMHYNYYCKLTVEHGHQNISPIQRKTLFFLGVWPATTTKTNMDSFTWTSAFGGGQWLGGSIDVNVKYVRYSRGIGLLFCVIFAQRAMRSANFYNWSIDLCFKRCFCYAEEAIVHYHSNGKFRVWICMQTDTYSGKSKITSL